jgi:hypothetical protein
MPRNRVQHQKGLSDDAFATLSGRGGMPEGVVCLALAGGLQVSAVRMDKVFRDPGPSTASVPAMGKEARPSHRGLSAPGASPSRWRGLWAKYGSENKCMTLHLTLHRG